MTKRVWLWTILLVVGLTGLILAFIIRDSDARSARQSAETEPIGLVALPVTWTAGDDTEEGHTVTFGYAVGDQAFSKTLENVTWYDSTRQYKICYDPANPGDAELYGREHVCGS